MTDAPSADEAKPVERTLTELVGLLNTFLRMVCQVDPLFAPDLGHAPQARPRNRRDRSRHSSKGEPVEWILVMFQGGTLPGSPGETVLAFSERINAEIRAAFHPMAEYHRQRVLALNAVEPLTLNTSKGMEESAMVYNYLTTGTFVSHPAIQHEPTATNVPLRPTMSGAVRFRSEEEATSAADAINAIFERERAPHVALLRAAIAERLKA